MLSMMASSSSVSASTAARNIARGGATTTRSGRVPIRSVLNDRNSLLVAKKINTTNTISRRKRNNRGELVVSNGLFGLGLPELVVIGGVTALLFGPSKLPELGKSLGKTVKSFQSAANEFNEELKKEVKEGEKENEGAKKEEEEEK
ncbi:twin arginine translocase protein A [Bathycoccus prasinos]|uniref:Twin arginine translocase protein A n=1 Tax=Bathycoccus prasinos TaxID=41875 RepID=K8E8U8_9CHLO|nr:twin arginine translocase protein A [Bathycoccus prasinos]CCO13999.1 twin arginine translocase protein A [Bathycoccus prasinos]|eukprot:XP_007515120.1 twin arginine translocase protein A [Bathycoccus prasinos]